MVAQKAADGFPRWGAVELPAEETLRLVACPPNGLTSLPVRPGGGRVDLKVPGAPPLRGRTGMGRTS